MTNFSYHFLFFLTFRRTPSRRLSSPILSFPLSYLTTLIMGYSFLLPHACKYLVTLPREDCLPSFKQRRRPQEPKRYLEINVFAHITTILRLLFLAHIDFSFLFTFCSQENHRISDITYLRYVRKVWCLWPNASHKKMTVMNL